MTIHEMMQQVALLSTGEYSRGGDISAISIPTPGQRNQLVYGKVEHHSDGDTGVLYTSVGTLNDQVDREHLLRINASLHYTRTALLEDNTIVLIATFEVHNTSIMECARIMQELAAVADDLELRWFNTDTE
ncbi:MAG: type III secretion system chaperone [Bacteroidetes bacterium]|nr:type III secretion system chaperone [Bacteroidota bacterium]